MDKVIIYIIKYIYNNLFVVNFESFIISRPFFVEGSTKCEASIRNEI